MSKAKKAMCSTGGGGGAVYGLGMVGSLIYYLQTSSNLMEGLFGILKALLWPAFLVHKVYTLLGM